jgi:bacterioferritin
MKGNDKVIAALNEALHEELTALSQYFVHAEMRENWKYVNLAKYTEKLIERILFLDGVPNLNYPTQFNIGKTVKEQLVNDLEAELGAVKSYNEAVTLSRAEGDNGSADLFAANLKDEEDHADWHEAQLNLIEEIGYERYLSRQMEND